MGRWAGMNKWGCGGVENRASQGKRKGIAIGERSGGFCGRYGEEMSTGKVYETTSAVWIMAGHANYP